MGSTVLQYPAWDVVGACRCLGVTGSWVLRVREKLNATLGLGKRFTLQQDNPGVSGGRLHAGPGVDQADSSLEPYQTSLQRPEHVYKRLISIQPDRTGRICTQERENSFKTRYGKLVEEDWRMQG